MSLSAIRGVSPRLFHPADDPDYGFPLPRDRARRHLLANILADCQAYAGCRPWKRIPERPDSPHPFHQLYLTFYCGMQATALIEHYAFAWRLTRDPRWLTQARAWLLAACAWEHSDRIEEHFYTANRYMHALAVGLDWLADQLQPAQEQRVQQCLVRLMQRWWPEVDKGRASREPGHHAVVDNGHFGVAALHLLGRHPDAAEWVEAVIERFRCSIMPSGCGRHGEPVDGPSFWPWENLWMLQFSDALRNVAGVDLYREFPSRTRRPLRWFRYQLAAADHTLSAGARQVWSPVLLRLAQEAGDQELRQVALADADLGRLYHFGVGAKGGRAECMLAYGPYAYCYLDPAFRPQTRPTLPRSRTFTRPRYGESAILRSAWTGACMVVQASGYRGGVAHGFSDLQVEWAGRAALRSICAAEAQPLSCGNLPSVGGQDEFVSSLEGLSRQTGLDRLRARSLRLDQEFSLLRGECPVLLVALRRRLRGVELVQEEDSGFVRLDGQEYLQYPREPHFSPRAGRLHLRVRLRREPEPQRGQVLFHTGMGIGGVTGPQVDNFGLGFFGGEGLVFAVQSQRGHQVQARVLPGEAAMAPGRWHEIGVEWGGLNTPGGQPFIAVELDGVRRVQTGSEAFGEVGRDAQGLSRTRPRTFFVKSNTVLGLGGGVQMPGTGTECDLGYLLLECAGRRPLRVDFAQGLGAETGSGDLEWKLNPADLRGLSPGRARLGAGARVLEALAVYPQELALAEEVVPFAPSGLAAGSLKRFAPAAEDPARRVLARAGSAQVLVLAFVPAQERAVVLHQEGGFTLQVGKTRHAFGVRARGRAVLTQR